MTIIPGGWGQNLAENLSFGVQNFLHIQVSDNQQEIECNREFYSIYIIVILMAL